MFEFVSQPFIMKIGIAFMAVAPVVLIVGIAHFFIVKKKIDKWEADELHNGSHDSSQGKSNE